jgi:hypothetical protein
MTEFGIDVECHGKIKGLREVIAQPFVVKP